MWVGRYPTGLLIVLAAVVLTLTIVPLARAQGVSDTPVLRIEAGMHLARIDRLDMDAGGQFLLTASDDKTARLWNAENGALVRTIRVPVDEYQEGRIYAVALSPDASTAVLGGWMSYGQAGMMLLVHEAGTGRLLHRVEGFDNVVTDLEFSPDGRWLAVATALDADLAIVDTQSWQVVHWLTGYDGSSQNVAWTPDGQLVTIALDGFIRVYDQQFRLVNAGTGSQGMYPFGLAISPEGLRLAVGYLDSPALEILDMRSLAPLFTVDTTGIGPDATLTAVDWSPDGQRLYGAGDDWTDDESDPRRHVWMWDEGGAGPAQRVRVAQNTVLDLKTLPDGRVAVAGGAPDITLLSADLDFIWQSESATLNFAAEDQSHFRLTADGTVIGVTPLNEAPLVFSLPDRMPQERALDAPGYRDAAGGMRFDDWQLSSGPLLNGRPIGVLDPFERVQSVDVQADGSFGVLGADWHIYGIEPDGSLRWRVPAPGAAFAVRIADSGNVLVAAFADGTMRWHRSSDGAELLALYIHPDRERWVAWTPSGYYDAAPGGEELLGWHINRGLDSAPDFFPAATFRDLYYRPDIIRQIPLMLDEEKAVIAAEAARAADGEPGEPWPATPPAELVGALAQALPPTMRILDPDPDTLIAQDRVQLGLEVTTATDAPLNDLRVFVNGRPQPDLVAQGTSPRQTLEVDLAGLRDDEVYLTVMGANRHGFGPPADLRLLRPADAAPDAGFQSFDVLPKLYVLAIGVSDYADPALNLGYAAKDAEDMAALFVAQAGGLYREVEVRLITNAEATVENMRDALFWLEEEVTANDTAKIFVAGHGMNDNRGELYFLTHDTDLDALRRTAFPASEFVRTIEYLPGRVVYFMDTCHSGNLVFDRRGGVVIDLNRHLQDLRAATGAVVLSSATGSQFALESPEWGNGAFTLALLQGLTGAADYNGDGSVSVNEIALFASEMVKELTNNQQTPVLRMPDGVRDFPLSLL